MATDNYSVLYRSVLYCNVEIVSRAYLRVFNVDVFQLVGVRTPQGLEPFDRLGEGK